MAFQQTFWVITGTAAPVIALAEVVALADFLRISVSLVRRAEDALGPVSRSVPNIELAAQFPANPVVNLMGKSAMVLLGHGLNFLFQAVLLAFSLVSVANQQNLLPIWLAVAIAVFGMLYLGFAAFAAHMLREEIMDRIRQTRAAPDDA